MFALKAICVACLSVSLKASSVQVTPSQSQQPVDVVTPNESRRSSRRDSVQPVSPGIVEQVPVKRASSLRTPSRVSSIERPISRHSVTSEAPRFTSDVQVPQASGVEEISQADNTLQNQVSDNDELFQAYLQHLKSHNLYIEKLLETKFDRMNTTYEESNTDAQKKEIVETAKKNVESFTTKLNNLIDQLATDLKELSLEDERLSNDQLITEEINRHLDALVVLLQNFLSDKAIEASSSVLSRARSSVTSIRRSQTATSIVKAEIDQIEDDLSSGQPVSPNRMSQLQEDLTNAQAAAAEVQVPAVNCEAVVQMCSNTYKEGNIPNDSTLFRAYEEMKSIPSDNVSE